MKLFDFNQYKKYLYTFHFYEADNDIHNEEKRRKELERKYSDEFLKEIIANTEEFIPLLLESIKNKNDVYKNTIYYNHRLPACPHSDFISTNVIGGWPSDLVIYLEDNKTKPISMHLLHVFFGINTTIYLNEEFFESFNEEEQVGIEYSLESIFIKLSLEEFLRIYEDYKKKETTHLRDTLLLVSNKKLHNQ